MQYYVWYNNKLENNYVRRLDRNPKRCLKKQSHLLKIGDILHKVVKDNGKFLGNIDRT